MARNRVRRSEFYDYDAVEESRRRWQGRGWEGSDEMAAAVSLMYTAGLVRASLDQTLRPFGLTYPRYEVLGVISFSREGQLAMGKIASRWRVHPATLTSTVDRLEVQGLVTRLPDVEDGRSVVAKITPAGEKCFDAATTAIRDAGFGLAELSGSRLRQLTETLREVRRSYDGFP